MALCLSIADSVYYQIN